MGCDKAGLEFKQLHAGALSLTATLHGHRVVGGGGLVLGRPSRKSEGGSELAKGRGAEQGRGGVEGGVPLDGSRGSLPAPTAALAVPTNLLLTGEEATGVGSEGRSRKMVPLSLLAPPCALAERLWHAGHGPWAARLCRQLWLPSWRRSGVIWSPLNAGMPLALADTLAAAS